MNILEKITDFEKNAIVTRADSCSEEGCHVGADYLLREWASAKERLFEAFGGELILKKDVTYRESSEQIEERIWAAKNEMPDQAARFFDSWMNFCRDFLRHQNQSFTYSYNYLTDVICFSNMARNAITYMEDCTLELPKADGGVRTYKVKIGMRPMRVVNRLLDAFPNNGYVTKEDAEAYAQWCSQFTTQRTLHGTLCVSIHPLDYMTMSDNSYDWNSCMSWEDEGCYRQGTVEMMNSRCVVVVYLAGDKPYYLPTFNDKHLEWSNKKWRELFIVDDAFICGIKGYPYQSESLTKGALEWLNEIMGGVYSDVRRFEVKRIAFDLEKKNPVTINGEDYDIRPRLTTRNMYNDFGSTEHYFCYNPDVIVEMADANHICNINLCYSGLPECMTCGQLDPDFDGEGRLSGACCYDDREYDYCEHCGTEWDVSDMCYVDDAYFCPDCMENEAVIKYDMITDEPHVAEDFIKVCLTGIDGSQRVGEMWIYNVDTYFDGVDLPEDTSKTININMSQLRDTRWVITCFIRAFGEAFTGKKEDNWIF